MVRTNLNACIDQGYIKYEQSTKGQTHNQRWSLAKIVPKIWPKKGKLNVDWFLTFLEMTSLLAYSMFIFYIFHNQQKCIIIGFNLIYNFDLSQQKQNLRRAYKLLHVFWNTLYICLGSQLIFTTEPLNGCIWNLVGMSDSGPKGLLFDSDIYIYILNRDFSIFL